jgi:ATP-dependent Lon protease
VALVDRLSVGDRIIVGVQKDSAVLDPSQVDLHPIAVAAQVDEIRRSGRGRRRLTLTGLHRVVLGDLNAAGPFLTVVSSRPEEGPSDLDRAAVLEALLREKLGEVRDQSSGKLRTLIDRVGDERVPGLLADRVAGGLGLDSDDEVAVLLATDIGVRLELVASLLSAAVTQGEVRRRIDSEVRREFNEGPDRRRAGGPAPWWRPYFLQDSDIHLHIPAGGVPKDGPSAGVAMFVALTSLLTGRRVRLCGWTRR